MKVIDYSTIQSLIPKEQQEPFISHYRLRQYVLSQDNEFEGSYIPDKQLVFKFTFDN